MAEYRIGTVEMDIVDCANCGLPFAMPEDYVKRRENDGESFQCPNGHSNYFPSGRNKDETIKELKKERDRFKARMYHFREEAEHKEYQRRGHKAAHTRIKNAISKGQCPCCGDQFEDLKTHMSSKHPDYKIEEEQQ